MATTVTYTIDKSDVFDEVAKTSSYVAAKAGDIALYDQIFTTDDDRLLLARFFREAISTVQELLKPFAPTFSINAETGDWTASVTLPSSHPVTLDPAIERALFSFVVNSVLANWFKIASKDNAEAYAADATAQLADARNKIFFKGRPQYTAPDPIDESSSSSSGQ